MCKNINAHGVFVVLAHFFLHNVQVFGVLNTLQRAYSASVRQALTLLSTKTKIPMVRKTLACQYTEVNDVLHLIESFAGQVIEQQYLTDINLQISIPEEKLTLFAEKLQTLSSGKIVLQSIIES